MSSPSEPTTESYPHSLYINDQETISRFNDNPDNTYLVSFPRTGSHWLRMMMELYFERPSLSRVFYHFENTNYLTLHTHDMDLDVTRQNVIYLYRNPADTIYSQISYYKRDHTDINEVRNWTQMYAQHLRKWLIQESFTHVKTVLTYENLTLDITAKFEKICKHLEVAVDARKLENAYKRITKDEVKRKTLHDPMVVSLEQDYEDKRVSFRERFKDCILQQILEIEPGLSRFIH